MSVLPTGLLCSGSTGTCRGQRLVEIDQPLLDSVGKDEQAAEIGQRLELDVWVAELTTDRDRLSQQRLADCGTRLRVRPDDLHPAVLRTIIPQLFEQGVSPGMPATLDGPISQHVSAGPTQRPRRAGGIDVATLSPVCRVSALVLCNGGGVLAFDVQRLTQAFEHLTGRNISQSLLERLTRSRCVTRAEGRPPLGDRRRAHQAMIARAGTPKLGYLLSLGQRGCGSHSAPDQRDGRARRPDGTPVTTSRLGCAAATVAGGRLARATTGMI
jgi:hypothetical protein